MSGDLEISETVRSAAFANLLNLEKFEMYFVLRLLQRLFCIIHPRVVQLLHSCGPLFKIIRVCGPQPAKTPIFVFSSQNHSVLQKKKTSLGIGLNPRLLFHQLAKPCYTRLPLLVIDKT